jgi:AmiR/NasT family two-component response regulator
MPENVVPLHPTSDRLAALQREDDHLRAARESRNLIEQAKGEISLRFGVTTDEAFELMRGLARSQQRNLREFAAEVVANGGRLG